MFADRANIPVSKIREIFKVLPHIKAQREKEDPKNPLIDLSIGQPHIAPNPVVMKQLNDMKANKTSLGYTSAQGEPETLEAIIMLYKKYYPGVQYKKTETMATMGGSGALSNIFSILAREDNVFLTFEPFFSAYTSQVEIWGSTLKKIPTKENNFRPTAEGLKQALKAFPNARALIMNYPNNPSGVSLTLQEAIELAKVLEEHLHTHPNFDIIIDDVYRDFNFSGEHVTILDIAPHLKDNCVVINSGAKGLLGAPGERVGMVAAREDLIRRMVAIQTSSISSVPHRTQAALRYAVENDLKNPNNDWLAHARIEYSTNVQTACKEFKNQGFTLSQPDGAFYLLVSAKNLIGKKNPYTLAEIKNDMDIANYFLHTAGVATVPGSGFGIDSTEGYLRISCAKENHLLIEAAIRMGKAAQLILNPELHLVSQLNHDINRYAPAVKMTGEGAKLFSGKVAMWSFANQGTGSVQHNDVRPNNIYRS